MSKGALQPLIPLIGGVRFSVFQLIYSEPLIYMNDVIISLHKGLSRLDLLLRWSSLVWT